MNRVLLPLLLISSIAMYADSEPTTAAVSQEVNLTAQLHAEARAHQNPNITKETHPVLYAMVEDLARKANTSMPRYITICDTQSLIIRKYQDEGHAYKDAYGNIIATVDILGDLYICRAIVTELSYQQVQGILAIALAEKASYKVVKVTAAGTLFGSFAGMVGAAIAARHAFNARSFRYSQNHANILPGSIAIGIAAGYVTANNLQRQLDIEAVRMTDIETVISGIKALEQLREIYVKEPLLHRIATAIKLDKVYNIVCYPIRAFTAQERINYLEALQQIKQ